jgi:hypothetical protein
MSDEPRDPERLEILKDAMREAIQAYLLFSDPENRMGRDEILGRLIDVLDRREVADAAKVDLPEAEGQPRVKRAG